MDTMGLGLLPFSTNGTFAGEVFAPTFQVAEDLTASTVQEL